MRVYDDPNNSALQETIKEMQIEISTTQTTLQEAIEFLLCIALSDDAVERFALYTKFIEANWELSNRMGDEMNNRVPDVVRQFQKMQKL